MNWIANHWQDIVAVALAIAAGLYAGKTFIRSIVRKSSGCAGCGKHRPSAPHAIGGHQDPRP